LRSVATSAFARAWVFAVRAASFALTEAAQYSLWVKSSRKGACAAPDAPAETWMKSHWLSAIFVDSDGATESRVSGTCGANWRKEQVVQEVWSAACGQPLTPASRQSRSNSLPIC